MDLPITAVTDHIDVIEYRGFDSARLAVHEVYDLFAVALIEERETIESGDHIQGSFRCERPAELACGHLHCLHSLLRLLSLIQENADGNQDADEDNSQWQQDFCQFVSVNINLQ